MRTIAKSLAIAAALAAALPLAARADRRDDHDGRHGVPPPAYGTPAPGHGPGRVPFRHHDWRASELRRIRSEIAALDARRAWFHERWAGRPGKLRKFDRWYFAERAALERQWGQLAWTAMR